MNPAILVIDPHCLQGYLRRWTAFESVDVGRSSGR
jgi:hypothetical protein